MLLKVDDVDDVDEGASLTEGRSCWMPQCQSCFSMVSHWYFNQGKEVKLLLLLLLLLVKVAAQRRTETTVGVQQAEVHRKRSQGEQILEQCLLLLLEVVGAFGAAATQGHIQGSAAHVMAQGEDQGVEAKKREEKGKEKILHLLPPSTLLKMTMEEGAGPL